MNFVNEFLDGSRALAPFLRNYAELIENGWARPFLVHNSKHKIVYAVNDNDVVMGGIAYALNQESHTGWIVLSFTESAFRRQGVYTALHAELEKVMRGAGMKSLASHVHVNNEVRQASCEQVGMVPEFYRMNKQL